MAAERPELLMYAAAKTDLMGFRGDIDLTVGQIRFE